MKPELFVLLMLFLYMPCHVLEEAKGDFPEWMSRHWTPMRLSYGHWMANNIFTFYPLLVVSYLLYYIFPKQCLFLGVAILIWGFVNFGDHAFYTIKESKVSPGLFTGMLYVVDAILGLSAFHSVGSLNTGTVIVAVVVGIALFLVPCFVSMKLGKRYMVLFGAYHE